MPVDEEGLAGRECDLEDPDGNRLQVATATLLIDRTAKEPARPRVGSSVRRYYDQPRPCREKEPP